MNQREKRFYEVMRKAINNRCHLSRIENVAGAGMPDLNLGYKAHDFWIELKHVEHKRFPVTIDWRPQQIAFTLQRNWRGSKVYLFIRFNNTLKSSRNLSYFLIPTVKIIHDVIKKKHKLQFKSFQDLMEKSIFHTKPNQKPDWDQFLNALHIQRMDRPELAKAYSDDGVEWYHQTPPK